MSVIHESAQQTLSDQVDEPNAGLIAELGLVQAVAWLALERSTRERAPISPGLHLTFGLVRLMEQCGICALDELGVSPGAVRAIYDPVQWIYLVDRGDADHLEQQLLAQVRKRASDADADHAKQVLWNVLANAEGESYLSAQLRRHGFDPSWAGQLCGLMEGEWARLPLSKRRYAIWAACRHGASYFLTEMPDPSELRYAIANELRRRSRWVAAAGLNSSSPEQAPKFSFVPFANWRRPILLDIFLSEVSNLGDAYWEEVPPRLSEPNGTGKTSPSPSTVVQRS